LHLICKDLTFISPISQVEDPTDNSGAKSVWLHRKGAAPSDRGPVVIPGSRGAFSYLVQPLQDVPFAKSGWSLAHGAGRVLARSAARTGGKLRHPNAIDLTTTALGSRVVCEDKALLYEERPEAYKDAACVVADLVAADLCIVIALLRPVLTYKMRSLQRPSDAYKSHHTKFS
jgi:release factor H-coupled RctB family protein